MFLAALPQKPWQILAKKPRAKFFKGERVFASKNRDTFFVWESFWLVVISTFDAMVYGKWTKLARPPVIIIFEKPVCNYNIILKILRVRNHAFTITLVTGIFYTVLSKHFSGRD